MAEDILKKGGKTGCLLLHGFTGSQAELLDLADFLARKKLTIMLPTLPGHGTYSGDMLNFGWREWFECAKRSYEQLAGICDEVFVVGLSMGGTLALHLAAHKKVRGIVCLAAPVMFPRWQRLGVTALSQVIRYRKKRRGEDVRDQDAKGKLGSYRRYPYRAVRQLFQLTEHTFADLPEIDAPILIMHSNLDHTISPENADIIFQTVQSQDKRMVKLEKSFHILSVDVEKDRVRKEIVDFVARISSATTSQSASHRKSPGATKPSVRSKKTPAGRKD